MLITLWTSAFPNSMVRAIGIGRVATAKTQLKAFDDALARYHEDVSAYPTHEQGLEALLNAPAGPKRPKARKSAYLEDVSAIPLNPWGNPYLYVSLGNGKSYQISCFGADGRPGGTGYDADLTTANP
jgi:general secretion pathway protein G